MRYWLMKCEPAAYTIDDLKRDKVTSWEGVRNYQARNFMRDRMQVGDPVLFYASNAEPSGVTGLAKIGKAFGIPTILTSVTAERGGKIFSQVQAVFPDQKPIDRTFINAWEDRRVAEAVKKTGRKKVVIAALWSEMCLAMPAIQAMGEGYDVYVVTDASGGVSPESHDMAIRRLVAAGAQPITWLGMAGELQRDWARTEKLGQVSQIMLDHAGATAASLAWQVQLLQAKEVKSP